MIKGKFAFIAGVIFFLVLFSSCRTVQKEKDPIDVEYVKTYDGHAVYKLHRNSSRGYNYDAYILLPSDREDYSIRNVLVTPNNSGYPASLEKLDEHVMRSITKSWEGMIACAINTVSLFPVFPRTDEVYYHAYGKDAYEATGRARRLDKQLFSMIADAKEFALQKGYETSEKVLLSGVSANACFSLRFASLHPEIVEAVAAGVPGIFPIFPTSKWPYPFGVSDIRFNYDDWKEIKMLIYEGDSEENTPWNEFQTMLRETDSTSHIEAWMKTIPDYLRKTKYTEILIYKDTGHEKQVNEMIEFFRKNSNGSEFTPVKPRKEAEVYLSPGITMEE